MRRTPDPTESPEAATSPEPEPTPTPVAPATPDPSRVKDNKITVWSYTDEVQIIIDNYAVYGLPDLKDPGVFLDMAQKLYDNSGGKVRICSTGDLFNPFKSGRKQGWVVDGKLVIDQNMIGLVELQKALKNNGYDSGASQWDAAWFAGINDTMVDRQSGICESLHRICNHERIISTGIRSQFRRLPVKHECDQQGEEFIP